MQSNRPRTLTSKESIESMLFGPGVEDDEELQALQNSPHPKHPKDPVEKMERILSYMEEMHNTTRDNNAILYQLIMSMEERINKRIEDVRAEMIDLINTRAASSPNSASTETTAILNTPTRRSSITDVKAATDKYKKNPASASEGAIPVTEAFYDMVDIKPQPGFVIKTRKLIGEKNKVFINVFHHDLIALTPPGLRPDQANDKPYLMMEAPTCTVDHAGHDCLTFNVGISSEYFKHPNPKVDIVITAPVTIYKIIHKINLRFNEFLDEGNYSLPRLATGYKGDVLPSFRVPKLRATRRDSGKEIIANPHAAPTAAMHVQLPPAGSDEHNRSTSTLGGTSPTAAAGAGGIASVWAATDHLNGNGNGNKLPPNRSATPPLHPSGNTATVMATGADGNANGYGHDNESVISDISAASVPPSNRGLPRRGSANSIDGSQIGGGGSNRSFRKIARKSILVSTATAGYNGGAIQGRNLLSGDMLEYKEHENVDNAAADALKQQSADDPLCLLGWQIWVQEGGENVLYVVTDVRKNFIGKTEHRISKYHTDDQWVKLKRRDAKSGLEFRPMRKVLFGLQQDDDTVG